MGYTHYWEFKKMPADIKNGDKKFNKAVTMLQDGLKKVPSTVEYSSYDWKTRKIVTEQVPFRLAGGNGKGKPEFTENEVVFNGYDDGKNDYSHETFYICLTDPTFEFNFCKTAEKPYDVAVCLALLCFKKAFGEDFHYSSDGDGSEYGWIKAHEIFDSL